VIHRLLALTRPLFVIDAETTGVDVKADRIVELSFQRWTAEGMDKEWRTLINPGVPIPAGATGVHHITDADVLACRACKRPGSAHPYHETPEPLQGMNVPPMSDELASMNDGCPAFKPWPTFKQLAANLAGGLTGCDFAGKNVRFDLAIMSYEFDRAGIAWSYAGARVVDADRLEQLGDPRTLGRLVKKHLGEDMGSEAHTALGDVQWTARLIEAQLRAYAALPRDLDLLHALQWPNWIDPDGKFRFVDGVPCFTRWGKHAGRPMRVADAGYWDFIISNDFSPEVKALAREAKLGRYPEVKA